MTFEEVTQLFPGGHLTPAGEYEVRCPVHKDNKPSLYFTRGDKGGIVMLCRAGCATADVLAAVGLTLRDMAPPGRNGHEPERFTESYRYDDRDGNLIATKHRKPNKSFAWQQVNGQWNLKGVTLPLFGLPEMLKSKPGDLICIAEGEKDVLNLRRKGLIATTNPHGASKGEPKWQQADTDWLKQNLPDREFLIFADNDEAGTKHADAIFHSLQRAGLSVRFADIPGLGPSEDISDWLPRHTEEEFQALLKPPEKKSHPLDLRVMDGLTLDKAELPTPEALVPHLLYRGFSTLLAGDSKLGKSSLELWAILAAACGGWWLDKERRSENRLPESRILFLNFEDPLFVTRDRARKMMAPEGLPENFLTMEPPYGYTLPQVLDWVHSSYERLALDAVVLDPLAIAAEWDDETNNSEVAKTLKMIQRLAAETQLALLSAHHVTKKPGQFGLNIRGGSAIKANVLGYLVLEREGTMFRLNGINKLSGEWDVTLDRTDRDYSWWITESRSGSTRTPQSAAKDLAKSDLLMLIGEAPLITTERLSEMLALKLRSCQRYLEEMKEAGLIIFQELPSDGKEGRRHFGWIRLPSGTS